MLVLALDLIDFCSEPGIRCPRNEFVPPLGRFQGDFVMCVVPSAGALGCSVFALQAVETRTRTSPNCSGRIGECGPIPAGGTSSLP
jgi:hypothetical protein